MQHHGLLCARRFVEHVFKAEDFAVRAAVARGEAARYVVAGHGRGAPGAGGEGAIGIREEVEVASASLAAAEDHRAVGQFLALGFVAARCGAFVHRAEDVPVFAEVVRVDHAVALVLRPKGGIEAVVIALLHHAALHDASRTHEERSHGDVCPVFHEQAIELIGYFHRRGPFPFVRRFIVCAHDFCHSVRVAVGVEGVIAVPANRLAANGEHEHLVAFAVGHDGGIAESVVECHGRCLYARTVGDEELRAPRCAVVFGDAGFQVYFTVADVAAAGAVVGNGDDVAVFGGGDCGNAVRLAVGIGRLEEHAVGIGGICEVERVFACCFERELAAVVGCAVEGAGSKVEAAVRIRTEAYSCADRQIGFTALRTSNCGHGISAVHRVGQLGNGVALEGCAVHRDVLRQIFFRVDYFKVPAVAAVSVAVEFQHIAHASMGVKADVLGVACGNDGISRHGIARVVLQRP